MVNVDLLQQFQFLLAGFVAAWVFYGLTPYKRPTPFERVVQALVYTAVVQLLAAALAALAGLAGLAGYAAWEAKSVKILSGPAGISLMAIFMGGAFAWLTNRDYPHILLRKFGITAQTARKCNWADGFDLDGYEYIILNLKDGRRLYGWPFAWPDTHADDHFLLKDYAWLPDQGEENEKNPDLSKIASAKRAMIMVASEAVDTVELLFDKTTDSPAEGDSP